MFAHDFDGTVAPSYSHASTQVISHSILPVQNIFTAYRSHLHRRVWGRDRSTRCKFFACDFVNRSTRVEDCMAKRSWFGSRAIHFFFVCITQWILISILKRRKKYYFSFFRFFDLARLNVNLQSIIRVALSFSAGAHIHPSDQWRSKKWVKSNIILTRVTRATAGHSSSSSYRASRTNEEKTHEHTMRNKASRWQWTLCKAYTFHHANIHTFAIIRQTHRPKHECVFNILHKH